VAGFRAIFHGNLSQVQQVETRLYERIETGNVHQISYRIRYIEGTTTPITFVHDILFPYVLE
jgi:hypothetical protein